MTRWTSADIPSQAGRCAIVTGTGGLGYETALALARAGGDVIIAGRHHGKGAEAVAHIVAEAPGATVRFEHLDLANLSSVGAFAERLRRQVDRVDLLINNAGVMIPPKRQETQDGFELQLGTNYLGHFALTAQLMPLLKRGVDPRVVTVSSIAVRSNGTIHFRDLNAERHYDPMSWYGQSKLACLMFALELDRRSMAAGWGVRSIGAHPGVSRTNLIHNGAGKRSVQGMARTYLWFLFQPVAQGALPILFAGTAPDAQGGGYYGPDKLGEVRGHPAPAIIPPLAQDQIASARLWQMAEEMTGSCFA